MAFERVTRAASIPAVFLALVLVVVSALPAAAITLLRDPDIEHGMNRIAAPILRAAGLSTTRTRIYLVNDSSFNAFVLDNRSIFLNYGLITKVNDVTLVQAVIAHEAAHISNGHLARRTANFQSSRTAAGLGLALAAIAAAASGEAEAGFGVAVGTQSAALRSFLSHTRAEEASADRSAAAYLTAAGISPQALVNLHRLFAGQELLSVARQDPYSRTHPLSRDRIRAAQAYVATHGSDAPDNPDADYWFARIKGKITAFKRAPKWTMRRIREEKYRDVRLMREAVAYHRQNNLGKALGSINQALSQRPGDPYYQELKAQILMENRRWNEALAAYKRASGRDPQNAQILGGYGRALLAAGQPKSAIQAMEKSRARDFRDARLLRDMSLAYARTGQNGMAAVVTAERYALLGRLNDAGLHAKRALALVPRGSAAWRRAQDVLIASERFAKGKKKR